MFDTGFLCVTHIVLELALYTRLALDSQRSFCYDALQYNCFIEKHFLGGEAQGPRVKLPEGNLNPHLGIQTSVGIFLLTCYL